MMTSNQIGQSHRQSVEINSNPKNGGRHSDDFKRSFNPKRIHNNRLLREAIAGHSFHSGRKLREQINFDAIRKIIREMLGVDNKKDKSPSLIEDSKPRNDNRQLMTDARRGTKKPSMNDFMNRRMKQRKRQLINDSKENKKEERRMLMG